jgi:hypothetical protein
LESDRYKSRSPDERVSAVEILRRQRYGHSKRLRRVAHVIQLKNKRALARKKDFTDIEALG